MSLLEKVSDVVDVRGRRMIELLNVSNVVVLNGVQDMKAQYTCNAARGQGIDDYIAVSCALVQNIRDRVFEE
jgi:hypothetical protein